MNDGCSYNWCICIEIIDTLLLSKLQPIGLQEGGKSTNNHIFFPMMESFSSLITCFQKELSCEAISSL